MRREEAHQQQAEMAAAEMSGPQASVGDAQTRPGSPLTAAPSPVLDSKRGNNPANHDPRRLTSDPHSSEGNGLLAVRCCLTFVFGMVW
jgi:hypothetical protein